jgi:RNA polymerase sigma-70 factor (ECF subfamily)
MDLTHSVTSRVLSAIDSPSTDRGRLSMFRSKGLSKKECEAFLRDNLGLLYRVAASYEAHPSIREDLLQEIVIAIWQAAARFEGRSSFKTYALRVAHNRAITHCTREARRPATLEIGEHHQDQSAGPEQEAERVMRQETLLAAVRELPIAQRQIIAMALEGMSYTEMGDVLEISSNNVGVRLNRARNRLQEIIDGMA